MKLFEVIQARQSVRAYQSKEVEPEKLRSILSAANQAPSAGNLQAYCIYLLREKSLKLTLAKACLGQEFVAQAPVLLVFCTEAERSAVRYATRGAALYTIQDATIAAAYAQLAAVAQGLATCWVGAFDEKEVAMAIGAPAGRRPVAILPIGYPAETPSRTPRRPLAQTVIETRG